MAVEARRFNNLISSHPQHNPNSGDFGAVAKLGGTNVYHVTMARAENGALPLISSSLKIPYNEAIFPSFYQPSVCDRNPPVKSVAGWLATSDDSFVRAPGKRARDSANYTWGDDLVMMPQKIRLLSSNRDIGLDIHRQQSELDRLIAQHTLRMRLEIEEKVRQQSKEVLAMIQRETLKKLREKDEEIQMIGKLNFALQERMKTLCMENQRLRGLAHTSEATANSLRSSLEQVLAVAHATEDFHHVCSATGVGEEDAESCCGSGKGAGEEEAVAVAVAESGGDGRGPRRACHGCGEKESCVLLLPCRHLCLCTACGSGVHGCPVCGSVMTGSVHVNMS